MFLLHYYLNLVNYAYIRNTIFLNAYNCLKKNLFILCLGNQIDNQIKLKCLDRKFKLKYIFMLINFEITGIDVTYKTQKLNLHKNKYM